MCFARSAALISQGDFCDPARYAGMGRRCRQARRLALGTDKPKYFLQTRSNGISDSPNSASRRLPNVDSHNACSMMSELVADCQPGILIQLSLYDRQRFGGWTTRCR